MHGWVVLDKPVGMTSTHAVGGRSSACSRRKRAGHAGTLDPLASGCLPIALGEATKTVPFVMDGAQALPLHRALGRGARHRRRRGQGGRRPARRGPAADAIAACLPAFHRHDRAGAAAVLRHQDRGRARLRPRPRRRGRSSWQPRPVEIHGLALVESPDADHAVFEAECGKGTYVRALARDMGRVLGCLGHVMRACAATRSARSAKTT